MNSRVATPQWDAQNLYMRAHRDAARVVGTVRHRIIFLCMHNYNYMPNISRIQVSQLARRVGEVST